MYEIEISHKGLNKYRHIKGWDKNIIEQKARTQQAVWDEMWEKRLTAEKKASSKEEKKELANTKTTDAKNSILEIKNILNNSLSINNEFNWSKLLDHSPFGEREPIRPIPSKHPNSPTKVDKIEYLREPLITDPEFLPQINFLDKLLGFRKKNKLTKCHNEYAHAHSEWIDKCSWIDSVNEKENEKYLDERAAWLNECNKIDNSNANKLSLYTKEKENWLNRKQLFNDNQEAYNANINTRKELYLKGETNAIIDNCELVLTNSFYPDFFNQDFEIDYNVKNRTLIIDFQLPNIEKLPKTKEIKYFVTKDEFSESFINEKELNSLYDELIYQVTLRTHHEIYESDVISAIDSVVFNGWVEFIDKAIGQLTNSCIVSLQTSKDEFLAINLSNVDPKSCFKQLRGIGSSKLHSISPIAPILTISKEDRRFIDAYSVANDIDHTSNLAAMDWQDFENLIREIFEKEFSSSGGEVKITQASRDGGVDAVAFDPDPIRGGKIVIQAKRYTNVVGVSAVRDLYGTTMNEGATKGILVTTADFGPDAYEFAKGKPLTLLNGGNLLHLLAKHGHKAKIDLKEAKKLLSTS